MITRNRHPQPPPALRHAGTSIAIFGLVALLLVCFVPVRGMARQDNPRKPYALIFGTVWGPDNRPVYGVKVKIRPADKKRAKWEHYSDHQGEFAQRVPAGKVDYIVWADAKDLKGIKSYDGHQLQSGAEVTVHITYDERQDISLHLK